MKSPFLFDGEYRSGYGIPAGVDEAGRGPLAGPLVAAAVILPPDFDHPRLTDSKKLTDRTRRELFPVITGAAEAYATGVVTSGEIDMNRMSWAVRTSFRRAMEPLTGKADLFLVDGNGVPGLDHPCRFIVKGDSKSLSIAAASIIAKVTRDDMMISAAAEYPGYGFEKHKGYGTRDHVEAIESMGPSPIHRMSFEPLRSMYPTGQLSLFQGRRNNPGAAAESRAAVHLENLGYRVLERNWRCPAGEIDIIAELDGTVYFVEVKSSNSGLDDMALARVGPVKTGRVRAAAAAWMAESGHAGGVSLICMLAVPGGFDMFSMHRG